MCSLQGVPTKQNKNKNKKHILLALLLSYTKLNELNFKNSYLKSASGIILPTTREKGKEQV